MNLTEKARAYIARFNREDEECYCQCIPNKDAESFLLKQIPLLECPEKDIEQMYYFRWWTYRKHIKQTPAGHLITEFLPDVRWAGPYNTIVCPVGFHIREGRWLKDPDGWLKETISFWLSNPGNELDYSTWLPHALWEYCQLKQDYDFGIRLLPQLIDFYTRREQLHMRQCGLYWSSDGRDGMEYSISGKGFRLTLNSYACADAMAISRFCDMAGDTQQAEAYRQKATQLKQAMTRLLWDGDFFRAIPAEKDWDEPLQSRPAVPAERRVRELQGYIPWYFGIADTVPAVPFDLLMQKDGFYAPYGLTSAEQTHPRFMEQHTHECLWNGPVWPFATSQTLVAAAELLRADPEASLRKEDYYTLLLQYTRSQQRTLPDGKTVCWIDENIDPYTGRWLARDILEGWNWRPEKGGYERGKDYNHSLYCDLILSGLLGICWEDGSLTAHPLIPDDWDYFRIENLWLGGKCYRIVYDKTGFHYRRGAGLSITQV